MPGVEGHSRFVAFDCAFLHIVSSDLLPLFCHWSSFILQRWSEEMIRMGERVAIVCGRQT